MFPLHGQEYYKMNKRSTPFFIFYSFLIFTIYSIKGVISLILSFSTSVTFFFFKSLLKIDIETITVSL